MNRKTDHLESNFYVVDDCDVYPEGKEKKEKKIKLVFSYGGPGGGGSHDVECEERDVEKEIKKMFEYHYFIQEYRKGMKEIRMEVPASICASCDYRNELCDCKKYYCLDIED